MTEKTLKTRLHTYSFSMSDPEQARQYKELRERIKADGPRDWMNSWGGKDRASYPPGRTKTETVELETKHLFSNQWNTACGRRVFDHFEEYPAIIAKSCKRGHWLEITDDMRAARARRFGCGYCGAQYDEPAQTFCDKCLDSPCLKASDLPLLRLQSVAKGRAPRPELSGAERLQLIPRYKAAQLHGSTERGKARLTKQRADLKRDADTAIEHAKTKRDGMLWLLDHGVSIDNCIYYTHTGRFGFGWQQPVDAEVYSELTEILCEFPFDYDIKTAEGVPA